MTMFGHVNNSLIIIFIVIFKGIVEHLGNMLNLQWLPVPIIFHPQLFPGVSEVLGPTVYQGSSLNNNFAC